LFIKAEVVDWALPRVPRANKRGYEAERELAPMRNTSK
jgi:hypothetical protein